MAVKIRLMRMGKKKQPSYRVVVADSRSPRDGRIIESIGRYDPREEPSLVEVDNDRAVHWLQVGAQPTERAQKLLEISGAWARYKIARGEVYTVPDRPAQVPAGDEPAAVSEEEEPVVSTEGDVPAAAVADAESTSEAPTAAAATEAEPAPADAGDAGTEEE